MSTRTVHDPFLGKDVQVSDRLADRLRGKYACGPAMENGEPEFGWRQHEAPPIQHEAADRIEVLQEQNRALEAALREVLEKLKASNASAWTIFDIRNIINAALAPEQDI